ncbi:hypothetical protein SAMN05444339_101154 [Loktanella atrilutea]|uniref:Entericidin EcnA/B family protein n=1 Tax=Loktanella atrilutea TaxID=366533 RepID=A0A1M4SVW6_LOKAT|nr:hypothetical protein [Loktanella atrilutea]SHE36177.1 hypothetical protein SAMN05444339_101154 [Loktanella atrilutea]
MTQRIICTFVLVSTAFLSACAPAVIGAGGAVAADAVAEDNGGNLF